MNDGQKRRDRRQNFDECCRARRNLRRDKDDQVDDREQRERDGRVRAVEVEARRSGFLKWKRKQMLEN